MRYLLRCAGISFAFAVGSCASHVIWSPEDLVDVNQGVLVTKGTKIEAEDGSFAILPDVPFKPPIRGNGPFIYSDGKYEERLLSDKFIRTNVARARVRVTAPGLAKPLYGKLYLARMPSNSRIKATGPASRSYQLEIPEHYVEAAKGGKVSVVFEKVDLVLDGKNLVGVSWALWLSDLPFPE